MDSAGGPTAIYQEINEDEESKIEGRPRFAAGYASYRASTPGQPRRSLDGRPEFKRKEIEIRRYTGKDSVEEYLLQFEIAARHNFWTDYDMASSLLCALDGPARGVLAEIDDVADVTYKDVKRALLARFGPAACPAAHEQALNLLRLGPGQNIRELSYEVQRLTKRAYRDLNGGARQQIMISFLLRAIPDNDVVFYIRDKEPKTMDEACSLYERFRLLSSTSNHRHLATRAVNTRDRSPDVSERPPSDTMRSFMDQTNHRLDEMSHALERLSVAPSSTTPRGTPPTTTATNFGSIPRSSCPECGLTGHWGRDCRLSDRSRKPAQPVQCLECNLPGHRWRDCPTLRPSGKRHGIDIDAKRSIHISASGSAEAPARTQRREPAVYVRARIDGKQRDCLLDTGAEVCLIPSNWVNRSLITRTSTRLLAVNGSEIEVEGELRQFVVIDHHRTTATFLVSPSLSEAILGIDWLTDNDVTWVFGERTIVMGSQRVTLRPKPGKTKYYQRCVARSDWSVPPQSEVILPVRLIYGRLGSPGDQQLSTVPAAPERGLLIARTLIDPRSLENGVRVCNPTRRQITIHEGQTISSLQDVATLPAAAEPNQETYIDHIAPILERIDENVPMEVRDEVRQLLTKYADVFSRDEFDLGCTDIVTHRIDTGDNRSFRQPLRPQPRSYLPEMDRLLTEMQQQGVIEPCQSEWASNIVLVKKKDGSIRFCVDYRRLNDLTKKDAYPLPRIETCLDTLAGSLWFSTFDLRSGFHQVTVDPKDVNKTTFICHRGTFRFPRMPFGLCGAPSTFQRLMDMVIAGLNYETCLVYLDDIIVFSKDTQSHMERLEKLLDRLRVANLKLKPSKCHIFQQKVSFLGFIVSSEGVGTDPDKIAAIRDWPTPANLRESRAFVGLCQYYRRFIPGFSDVAAALHALTKKGARFLWTEECQNAFDALKSALIGAEVLALPTEEGNFILDCDASDTGIGAVLSQMQNGEERPICYASQLYNRHEKNYNVTRKELLALITFVKKFRQYLLGRPFTIRTDHAALQWLKKTPEPIGQQARWLEILEEFDYHVQHRPGTKHTNADAMSRRPPSNHSDPAVAAASTAGPDVVAPFDWAKVQQEDPDVGFLYRLLQNQSPRPRQEDITSLSSDAKSLCSQYDQMQLGTDGILYRKFHKAEGGIHLQKVVPFHYRHEIAADMHRGLNGGHFGIQRAMHQLQGRFYWPGWSRDLRQTLMQCDQCARFKRPRPHRQGCLKPMLTGEPWERIGVDITGPHPKSSKGNVYILTLIDHFTKWAEMFPIRNQEASTVAKILVDRVFCVHGMPLQLLTDQGPNFESHLFQEICRALSIDKIRTTAYRPSTNGNVERLHGTLNSILAKWVSSNHRDWDDRLPAVAFAYRTSVQESTGFTPFFLMYGREATIPADIVYGMPPRETEQRSHVEFVSEQQENLHDAFVLVREHLHRAAERRKSRYDMRVRPCSFEPGTWVWCLIPRRRQGRSAKWTSFYQGPYLITRKISDLNMEIQRSRRAKPMIIHIDKLKPCYTPGLRSWVCDPPTEGRCSNTPPQPGESPHRALSPDRSSSIGGQEDEILSNVGSEDNADDPEDSTLLSPSEQRPRRQTRRPARFCDTVRVAMCGKEHCRGSADILPLRIIPRRWEDVTKRPL